MVDNNRYKQWNRTREEKVRAFQTISNTNSYKHYGDLVVRRMALMEEELEEVEEALMFGDDKENILKELCDLQYVLSGTIVSLGLADVFDEAFDRVHKSNMAKVEGEITVDEDGKIMKPIGWKKPSLKDLV